MELNEILKEITAICRACAVKKLILFGSYAKGTAHKTSDIDIAVAGAPDFDLLESKINLIDTLRTIDIVDLNQTALSKSLLKDIDEYGQVLYQQI